MNCVANTSLNGILEDICIIHINKEWHMIIFAVPWGNSKVSQTKFGLGCSVILTKWHNPWYFWKTIDCVSNTPLKKILKDSLINHIPISWYMITFTVPWIEFHGFQTILYLVLMIFARNGTTLENITKLWVVLLTHFLMEYWNKFVLFIFINNGIWLSLQFNGCKFQDKSNNFSFGCINT